MRVRLFDRTTRHVALTSAGSQLQDVALSNLQELDGVMSRLGQSPGDTRRSFSLGAPTFWTASVLAKAIKEFRARCSDFQLRVFDGDTATILPQVDLVPWIWGSDSFSST